LEELRLRRPDGAGVRDILGREDGAVGCPIWAEYSAGFCVSCSCFLRILMNIDDDESLVLVRDIFCSCQITILMVKRLVRSNARLEDEIVMSVGLYSCLLTGCLIFCMFLTAGKL
jgi:hypothetical protein